MRASKHESDGKTIGYTLWLSARDTYRWANRSGARWPGSTLADHRLVVTVDQNGLCDLTVDGRYDWADLDGNDLDGNELDALVADHVPAGCRHLWPVWEGELCQG